MHLRFDLLQGLRFVFDMTNTVPTTAEIVALRGLERGVDERWCAWAISLLEKGTDTPSLSVLAGERPPYNQFELGELVDRVLVELGVSKYSCVEDAAVAYASVRTQHLLSGCDTADVVLSELGALCWELELSGDIHDFYLLHWGLDDLKHDTMCYHWPDANRGNIHQIIRNCCQKWLKKYPAPDL